MGKKYVYDFGGGKSDGKADMKGLLGGKGANLAEMGNLGIPVPPGFTITTEVCTYYYDNDRKYPEELEKELHKGAKHIEKVMRAKFGSADKPLLLSIRSGARASMPGMMDTVLNLGLNDETIQGLIKASNDERFAYDCYRRFVQMYSDVVLEADSEKFEHIIDKVKLEKGVRLDTELAAEDWKGMVAEFKRVASEDTGRPFPDDPWEQLWGGIGAVFGSWNNKRAIDYRNINNIPHDWGTAVNVQAMVYGNLGDNSATGVAFTRDPSTGENIFYGEFLRKAQGEDVVAGIRTPQPINIARKKEGDIETLEESFPECYRELEGIYKKLECHYKDMQDIEFTIQDGHLWMLQTRNGKRTAAAAVRIAVDMVSEGLITKEEAIKRMDAAQLDQLLHPRLDPEAPKEVIGKGLPASPGAAVGKIVFSAEEAEKWEERGEDVVLVRIETSPDDIHGMHVAKGILTARGGMTCIGEGTRILTDGGFFTVEEVFKKIEEGEKIRILSYDSASRSAKWKNIIAAGRKKSPIITIDVSQTGRVKGNYLQLTDDHKVYTLSNRKLVKEPVAKVIKEGKHCCLVDFIPPCGSEKKGMEKLAYIAGAIFTDGYICLKRTKGYVVFTQKPSPAKLKFINTVRRYFKDAVGFSFNNERMKYSKGKLRGRLIEGEALDLICNKRGAAEKLKDISDNMDKWILSLDDCALLHFIAGVVDGDGTFSAANNRINIFASKKNIVQGIVLACLKLGIVPQVTKNRNISNIQIVERLADIFKYTKRVRGRVRERLYGTKFFSARGLFEDIWKDVNYQGKLGECIKRNLFMDVDKIKRDILPLCNPKKEVRNLIESDFRMFRITKVTGRKVTWVYNFEVRAEREIDKNFVVFTENYTPLIVSNSHAAVVARGMGKCCVAGCGDLKIDYAGRQVDVRGTVLKEGDWITLDGTAGEVILGRVPTIEPELTGEFGTLMEWVDGFRKLKVRTNADTPHDSQVAKNFGAEGIGLCRTEHMFFEAERIEVFREMIVADDKEGRKRALAKLLPIQKGDFKGIFRVMRNLPVTVRLLDPPLHEFLPHTEREIRELAGRIGISEKRLREKVESLKEQNPMLGHRGCRLGVTYPEIYAMQAQAIMEAVCELKKEEGIDSVPEIEIPLVGHVNELRQMRAVVVKVAEEVIGRTGVRVPYKVGTMIELVRAAITADQVAHQADFFSFGTNDLTQTTFGLSRDDAGKFLPEYVKKHILARDPFVAIDREGVGEIMKIAVEKGRSVKSDLEIGICGEHGGEPSSVIFCHEIGLNYVSCSPYRVPIARLAAAQAALKSVSR